MTWASAPRILETTDIDRVYTDAHEPVVTLDNGATALVLYVVVREESAKHPAVADVPGYLAVPEMPARLLPVAEAFIVDEYHAPSAAPVVPETPVAAPVEAAVPEVPEAAEPESADDGERGEPGTGPDAEPETPETEA